MDDLYDMNAPGANQQKANPMEMQKSGLLTPPNLAAGPIHQLNLHPDNMVGGGNIQ